MTSFSLALVLAGCSASTPPPERTAEGESRNEVHRDETANISGPWDLVQKPGEGLCMVDTDCQAPSICLQPEGSSGPRGICGTAIDHMGRPIPDAVRQVRSCQADAECPSDFVCLLVNGPWGACVKK